jgi:hypothetical protein
MKIWVGRVMSAIPVLLLLFAGVTKVMKAAPVLRGLAEFGYPQNLVRGIGITELACTLLYLIPRTSVLGAILLTGFLGGATATSVRVGDPMFYLPIIIGALFWGGLYFRDQRLRALIPTISKRK